MKTETGRNEGVRGEIERQTVRQRKRGSEEGREVGRAKET